MSIFRFYHNSRPVLLGVIITFMLGLVVHAQTPLAKDDPPKENASVLSAPAAVSVLTPTEAEKANNDALKEYKKNEGKEKKGVFAKCLNGLFLGVLIVLYLVSTSRLTTNPLQKEKQE